MCGDVNCFVSEVDDDDDKHPGRTIRGNGYSHYVGLCPASTLSI